jgi:CRISPR-associated endonuclease/helicase Cas3
MPAPRKSTNRKSGEGPVPRHEDCWGKTTEANQPGINVRDHCLNVGCIAEALLERLPELVKSALMTCSAPILAALHDVGKVSPGFQCKCESWLIGRGFKNRALQEGWAVSEQDHAKISQFAIQQILDRSELRTWAAIIGAHHGKAKGVRIPYLGEPSHAAWDAERRRLAEELIGVFGPLPDQPGDDPALWFQAGLVAVADWLGSNEEFFPWQSNPDLQERRRRARQALDSIGWIPPRFRSGVSFATLFNGY